MTLEHYPGMAEDEIARHVAEAERRWPLLGVTVIHRYGRIVPGDNIVLVVTASAHRSDAFAAAEFLMDYLKTRAPFWKQEERADGSDLGRRQGGGRRAAERWHPSRAAKRRNKTTSVRTRAETSGGDDEASMVVPRRCLRSAFQPANAAQVSLLPASRRRLSARRRARARRHRLVSPASARASSAASIPKTGKNEEIPLGPGAAPHGVIVGPDGAPWVTEGGQNAIARVDPATRAVKLFPLPDDFAQRQPQHADLRQERRASGSPDRPASMAASIRSPARSTPGRRRKAAGPTASRPRRRATSGTPRSPATISRRIDTATGASDRRRSAAQAASGPRRIWSDSKGILWVSFWNAGDIGRYDPAAKSWKTYPLPRSTARLLFDLRRRQGPRLGHRLARQRDPAFRSGDRNTHDLPERQEAAPTCARCSDARAKPGAANRAPTGWWWCGIRSPVARSERRSTIRGGVKTLQRRPKSARSIKSSEWPAPGLDDTRLS